MNFHYRAVCVKCGHVQKEGDNRDFLDAFFLPSCCPKCGDVKSKRWRDMETGWDIQRGRYEAPPGVIWWMPWTWKPRVWVEAID
jgi:hypothetical protein